MLRTFLNSSLRSTVGVRKKKFVRVTLLLLFCQLALFPYITSKAPFPLKQQRLRPFCFRIALFLLSFLVPPIALLLLGTVRRRESKRFNFWHFQIHESGEFFVHRSRLWIGFEKYICASLFCSWGYLPKQKNNDKIPNYFTYIQYARLFWPRGQKSAFQFDSTQPLKRRKTFSKIFLAQFFNKPFWYEVPLSQPNVN